jgi:rhodanese-related sulfurtransferase
VKRFTVNHYLAAAAGVLALGALLVGDRGAKESGRVKDITTVQLAHWIKEKKEGLRVIDMRESKDFTTYHIPSAQQFTADVIAPSTAPVTLVLYSDTGSVSDRKFAEALLPEGSSSEVYVLRGGVNAWLHEIMLPRLPATPTAEQRQSYEERRELSQYFGGRASAIEAESGRESTAEAVRKLKRMGCL